MEPNGLYPYPAPLRGSTFPTRGHKGEGRPAAMSGAHFGSDALTFPRPRIVRIKRRNVRPRTLRRMTGIGADVDEAHHALVWRKAEDAAPLLHVRIPVGYPVRRVAHGICGNDEVKVFGAGGRAVELATPR